MSLRTYIIFPEKDISDSILEYSLDTEASYNRSTDGTLSILKFTHKHPDCGIGYVKYTHDQILEILKGPEWTPEVVI